MEQFFPASTYHTDPDKNRFFWDQISLGSRFYFYYKYIRLIFKYRPLAIKDQYDDKAWADSSHDMLEIVERCGGRVEISGLENIRAETEPVVFVCNHMSTAESQLMPGIVEPIKPVTFVVKESLMKGPIWGPVMRARRPIVVSRVDPRKDMMEVLEKGMENLKKGRSVFIFPQATRTVKFIPENFSSLGIKLAKKAGVKIQPCALKTDFWGNGKFLTTFGPIRRKQPIFFSFAPAVEIVGNGKEQHQHTIEYIQAQLKKWNH